MYDEMMTVLKFLTKKSMADAKQFGSIIYKTYPSLDTRNDVERALKGTVPSNDENKQWNVYTPNFESFKDKKKVKDVVEVKPPVKPESVITDNVILTPQPTQSVKDYLNMAEEEIFEKFESLGGFKKYLNTTFDLNIPKNANFEAVMEKIKGL